MGPDGCRVSGVKGEVITEALLIGPLGSADLGKRLGGFWFRGHFHT